MANSVCLIDVAYLMWFMQELNVLQFVINSTQHDKFSLSVFNVNRAETFSELKPNLQKVSRQVTQSNDQRSVDRLNKA